MAPDKRERRERKDLSFVECLLFFLLISKVPFSCYSAGETEIERKKEAKKKFR